MVVVVFLPIFLPECQPGDRSTTKWFRCPKLIVVAFILMGRAQMHYAELSTMGFRGIPCIPDGRYRGLSRSMGGMD